MIIHIYMLFCCVRKFLLTKPNTKCELKGNELSLHSQTHADKIILEGGTGCNGQTRRDHWSLYAKVNREADVLSSDPVYTDVTDHCGTHKMDQVKEQT